jgi:2-keto-3-deoxy-L-rhamnonate aldolase RhmA
MREHGILRAVREGRVAIGQMAREFRNQGLAQMMEYAGLDFMYFDMEHGAYDVKDLAYQAGWFKATSVSPMVRIHKIYNHFIPALLDQGFMGINVSSIETVQDARALVQDSKYPPIGNRGISMMGAHTDYRGFTQAEYAPVANRNINISAAIESVLGVENVDAIAAIDGIDMVSVGFSDLSARMGIHLQLQDPRFKEVMRLITDACKKHGKQCLAYPQSDEEMEEYYHMGVDVMSVRKTDLVMYRDALKESADYMRARLGPKPATASRG